MPKLKQLPLPMRRPEEVIRLEEQAVPTIVRSMAALLLQVLEAEKKESDDDRGS